MRILRAARADEALWELLNLQEAFCSRRELADSLQGDLSARSLVFELASRGFCPRQVDLQVADISYLVTPALIELQDHSWVVIRSRASRALAVAGVRGQRHGHLVPLSTQLSGIAIELVPPFRSGCSLWPALGGVLAQHRRILLQAVAAGMLVLSFGLLPPYLTRTVLDRALPDGARSLLAVVAAGLLLTGTLQAVTGWLRERTTLHLKARLETIAGRGFFEHLLRLPFPFLNDKSLGEVLQAFYGLDVALELLTDRGIGAVFDGLTVLLYPVFMISMMAAPSAAVFSVAVILTGLALSVGYRQADIQEREVQVQSKARGFLGELVTGIATLKAAGAEKEGETRWRDYARRELLLGLRRQRIGIWTDVGFEVIPQAATVSLLIWGGSRVLAGQATLGSLLAFVQLSTAFLAAVAGLAHACRGLLEARPQLARAGQVLAIPARGISRRRKSVLCESVSLENVWFRHSPESPWVLKSYHLHVEPGTRWQIQGPSGFGKTTILRLIAGLYVPERGSIRIGDMDASTTSDVLYLPQSLRLLSGSINDNLSILSGNAGYERIMEAAEHTGLSEWVRTLPMGYETLTSHGGQSLSGGQRQLVAMTAVAASTARVLLLDEPLANLDAVAQARIFASKPLVGRTIVYATHANLVSAA